MGAFVENAGVGQIDALHDAWEVQLDASAVGFDWPDPTGALDKVIEEVQEIRDALSQGDVEHAKTELGDLLFAAVNVARLLGAQPSKHLLASSEKFQERFSNLRENLERRGRTVSECSLDELDKIWEQVKAFE